MSSTPGIFLRWNRSGIPILAARIILGGYFIWLGLAKAAAPVEFLKLLRQYQMVPEGLPVTLNLVAAILPGLEVLCGVLLIFGVAIRGVAVLVLSLLAVFTFAVSARALGIYQAEEIALCAIKFDRCKLRGERPLCLDNCTGVHLGTSMPEQGLATPSNHWGLERSLCNASKPGLSHRRHRRRSRRRDVGRNSGPNERGRY